ncbi:hypothetical protein [Streptomyces antibioticus]|uniref:hypothetical protein n=1 Tax=Streptomyces antibioticus TaxID=1890 RepID=UPI0033C90B2F
MTAIDDLITEDVPTHPTPAPRRPRPYESQWTRAEQDQHWRELCTAIGTPNAQRPTPAPGTPQPERTTT